MQKQGTERVRDWGIKEQGIESRDYWIGDFGKILLCPYRNSRTDLKDLVMRILGSSNASLLRQ